jgi:hypothetical protein
MLEDFIRYFQTAKEQGNKEAMEMIKHVIFRLLEDE